VSLSPPIEALVLCVTHHTHPPHSPSCSNRMHRLPNGYGLRCTNEAKALPDLELAWLRKTGIR
jgi:hypothetical protein